MTEKAKMLSDSSVVEDNTAGKAFEADVCKGIRKLLSKWKYIKAFTMQELFDKLGNELQGRVEDYSDICIMNMKTGKQVFVECKEEFGANVANMKFQISEDGKIQFVHGKTPKLLKNSLTEKLAKDLMSQDSFKAFLEFMYMPSKHLDGNTPADYYFGAIESTQALVSKLAILVNKNRQIYNTTAKYIPLGKFTETTLPSWVLALSWKLSDLNHTHIYDICSVDIDYMSDLVLRHYDFQKKFPASYAQIEDNLYLFHSGQNPLRLSIAGKEPTVLSQISGRYTLKFTPRLSNPKDLKIYLDARSYFMEDLPASNCSFIGKADRIPDIGTSIDQTRSK